MSSTNRNDALPSFKNGKRGMFGLIIRTTTTPGTDSNRISTYSPLTFNSASPFVNASLIAPLISLGGVTVTVSLSDNKSNIGLNDLTLSMK